MAFDPWFDEVKVAEGWLSRHRFKKIEKLDDGHVQERVRQTKLIGKMPLWEGYKSVENYPRSTSGSRTPNQVSTGRRMGRVFAWLAQQKSADTVVEFGSAFGVSGMYWLLGLEAAESGLLQSFEANEVWADVAEENLSSISPRYNLTRGLFEERAPEVLCAYGVDIAFVDGIHTSGFIHSQFQILLNYMKPSGLILFDDIGFSDDMRAGWKAIAQSDLVHASGEIRGMVGIVEIPPG